MAIKAKDDEIKVGKVLRQTAQDHIRSLESDIASIKEEATARLAMPVGEHIAHCLADRGPREQVPQPEEPRIAAPGVAPIRDDFKEEPVGTADLGLPGDDIEDPWWLIEFTPSPFPPPSLQSPPRLPGSSFSITLLRAQVFKLFAFFAKLEPGNCTTYAYRPV